MGFFPRNNGRLLHQLGRSWWHFGIAGADGNINFQMYCILMRCRDGPSFVRGQKTHLDGFFVVFTGREDAMIEWENCERSVL